MDSLLFTVNQVFGLSNGDKIKQNQEEQITSPTATIEEQNQRDKQLLILIYDQIFKKAEERLFAAAQKFGFEIYSLDSIQDRKVTIFLKPKPTVT
jgi:hypothetical protein